MIAWTVYYDCVSERPEWMLWRVSGGERYYVGDVRWYQGAGWIARRVGSNRIVACGSLIASASALVDACMGAK